MTMNESEAGQAPARVVLDEPAFEAFLCGIANEVFANMLAVRAGKLKAEEAAERDDANVRNLARVLMGEHDRITAALPLIGPKLAVEMRTNIPALFRGMPKDVDPDNPRALLVHASRMFLSEIYTMMRAFIAEGDKLSPEGVRERIEGSGALWAVRFMGDAPGRFN